MQRLAVAVASLVVSMVVGGGCHQDNPESCELPANAGIGTCPPVDATDAPQEAQPECTMNSQCTVNPDKGVCDTALNGGTCVQCTAASQAACKGASLACINDACALCTKHSDCVDSNVCMPDGTCANAADVAYVDGGGTDQMTCSQGVKCTRIEKAVMAKNIVKISGTVTERATLDDKTVLILADPGARLTPTQDGAALDIRGDSKIQIYDLEISHLPGGAMKDGLALNNNAEVKLTNVRLVNNSGDGAHISNGHLTCTHCTVATNAGRGIIMDNGELTISRSEIKVNLGGGIFIPSTGKLQIVGNVIYGNGSSSSQAGGIALSVPADSTNRIDFNSISHNSATLGTAPGIHCISSLPLTGKYNIIFNNGADIQVNTPSNCSYALSDIGPLPTPATVTNFNTPPSFVNEAGGDLHLMSSSPVRKLAQPPAADLSGLAEQDIDGDSRASVIMVDLGADQVPQ